MPRANRRSGCNCRRPEFAKGHAIAALKAYDRALSLDPTAVDEQMRTKGRGRSCALLYPAVASSAGFERSDGTHYDTRSARTSRCAARRQKQIQEAAGHASLTTTLKYMHLAPRVLDDAIGLLEKDVAWQKRGKENEKAANPG